MSFPCFRSSWSYAAATILTAAVALTGFERPQDAEGSTAETAKQNTNKKKSESSSDKTFTYALSDDPETFDTAKMSGAPEGRVAFNIFEGLLTPAKTTKGAKSSEDLVRPGVAKNWKVSDDGKTYTFHLREDAKWSNGQPVTAQDFAYAWKRAITPGFPADYAQLLNVIKNAEAYNTGEISDFSKVGVETPDKHTLVVHLKHPTPYFLELCAFYTFFPQPKKVIEKHGEKWTRSKNIVTNGPYILKSYKPQQEIVLEKNPDYWDAENVDIERAKLRIIKDKNAVVNAYKTGELDWTGTRLPISQISSLLMHDDYNREPMLGIYYYRINVTNEDSPLNNPKVRRALGLAVDRGSIVENVLNGLYDRANSFVPKNMPGYESTTTTNFDVKKARKLLAEAGYPEGEGFPTITVLYNTDKNHKLVAESIQAMWKKNLGVDIELQNKEWKTYLEDIDNLNYQIARAGWIGDYNDPMTFLDMWVTGNGNNDTGWSNDKYDSLIAKARETTDEDKRRKILQEAETLLMEKGPVIPIYDLSNNMLLSSDVKGFNPHNRNIHLLKDLSFAE
ncbi:MAG: peptide ABC transporter substrate-binding protein [Bradymonadaceae bacterium]